MESSYIKRFLAKAIPTRRLYDCLKGKATATEAANFKRTWPTYFLLIEIVVAVLLSLGTFLPCVPRQSLIVRWVAYAAAILAASRVAEIAYAYYYDAMDRLNDKSTDLTKGDRIGLVMKSYPSLVINWAVIYFVLPRTQFQTPYPFSSFIDALYFSGVTISTVGYGDIVPTGHWSRLLCIGEIWSGMLVLLIALGTYLAASNEKAAKD
jgi:voltage-gated potassium channel